MLPSQARRSLLHPLPTDLIAGTGFRTSALAGICLSRLHRGYVEIATMHNRHLFNVGLLEGPKNRPQAGTAVSIPMFFWGLPSSPMHNANNSSYCSEPQLSQVVQSYHVVLLCICEPSLSPRRNLSTDYMVLTLRSPTPVAVFFFRSLPARRPF